MDILFFLKRRIGFIRYFYETAEKPFRTTILQIEGEKPPFDNPSCEKSDEPPYLIEWVQAKECLEFLGRACLSALSSSLHLYFKEWERKLGIKFEKDERKRIFRNGFLRGYQTCFRKALGLSWDKCPADIDMIEQIILARNREQHPEHISSMKASHAPRDIEKYPRPFFMSEVDYRMMIDFETESVSFMMPSVHVDREKLFESVEELEKFTEWLEETLTPIRNN